MGKAQSLLAVLLLAGAVSAQEGDTAQPAKPRSVDELLKDRATVQDALGKLTKSWESNRNEFEKLAVTKEYKVKQTKLQEVFQITDRRLKELDGQIAGAVAKERKESK